MEEDRFRLRICYAKDGRLRYLSHLELVRCMERCIRRAGLPYLVTQGFSPHMRSAFGWALPVGVASFDEYLDVLLGEYVPPERVLAAFEGCMPAGLSVLDACYVDTKAPSLTEAFPCSVYACEFDQTAGEGEEDAILAAPALLELAQSALAEVLEAGSMTVERKKKTKVVEFAPLLKGEPSLELTQDGTVLMRMKTFTEGKGALRPDLFCAELIKRQPLLHVRSLTRTDQLPE